MYNQDEPHDLVDDNVRSRNESDLLSQLEGGSNEANHSYGSTQLVDPPKSGMEFGSMDEVRAYYTKYARQVGFGIMTRTSIKREDGQIHYLVLSCTREGNRRASKTGKTLKNCPSMKQNCDAKITVSLCDDGQCRIKLAVIDHNHEVSPTKSRLCRSNKHLDMQVKRTLELNDAAEVRANKSFQTLVVEAGSHENLTFCERDCRNYIEKVRRVIGKGGDGDALHKYFLRMQEQNNNFFYVIDLDDTMRVRNVFWADARSRATYESFGDVVTFDTIYLTNQYQMPLAAFVGVNHHGQSILLGCGLLSCDDTESFVWLFQSWLKCMHCVPPKGIITDQCQAMQNAIEIVFPSTQHRWCLWHIMKKLPQKLGSYAEYKSISHVLKSVVYDSLTPDQFEEGWMKLVEQFDLQDNEWLTGLFLERTRWVPSYLRRSFWAGMSTSQRGESMHAFFDGYVNQQTSLKQFLMQYDNALRDKAEKEFEADFRSFFSTLPCATKSPFERQFQSAYTHSKFKEVQVEFVGKADCSLQVTHDEGHICHYVVVEDVIVGDKPKKARFEVTFDRVNIDVNCTCLLFQFRGIICRHSLAILSQEQINEVPCKYILDRWKKNVKRKHTFIKTSYDIKQLKPQMQRFELLCKQFYGVAEAAAEFEETTTFVQDGLHELMCKVEKMALGLRNSAKDKRTTSIERVANISVNMNDSSVCWKGRPASKRLVSILDKNGRRKRQKEKECNGMSSPLANESNAAVGASRNPYPTTTATQSCSQDYVSTNSDVLLLSSNSCVHPEFQVTHHSEAPIESISFQE